MDSAILILDEVLGILEKEKANSRICSRKTRGAGLCEAHERAKFFPDQAGSKDVADLAAAVGRQVKDAGVVAKCIR